MYILCVFVDSTNIKEKKKTTKSLDKHCAVVCVCLQVLDVNLSATHEMR